MPPTNEELDERLRRLRRLVRKLLSFTVDQETEYTVEEIRSDRDNDPEGDD